MDIEPCPHCQDFRAEIPFDYSDAERFKQFHDILDHAVREGRFIVESGALVWSDFIECVLRCSRCASRFRLTCETAHGRGGRWAPEAG